MMYTPGPSTKKWIHENVNSLPPRWQKKLINRWESEVPGGRNYKDVAGQSPEFLANTNLRIWAKRLNASRLPLDAGDTTICEAADALASKASELANVFHEISALRAALNRVAEGQDVIPPKPWDEHRQTGVKDGPAIARMTDPLWWRLKLRKVHAQNVEGAAIDLGYVNRARDCYVSNESLYRRAQQNERNAAMLENTTVANEFGQEYTLAELAAKGVANKAIRRAELMTRISGFERIALDMQHTGLFFTLTCPSRMHKWATAKSGENRVFENPRYDGTMPNEAQQYLQKVWAKIRASLARRDIRQYGFRIAEPNHDGTPHWHFLVFLPKDELAMFQTTVWKYALQDSPDEPGAKRHRVDFKEIDAGRGSAAGYIAKYVAKNIDGYRLDTDLFGNDAITAAHRVEAWAATWRIRQFQQVGGPPVGPWRELRRIKELPASAPKHVIDAHHAANKISGLEAGAVKAVAWDRYCKAQGGVFCGRNARIKLSKIQPDGMNKYGEKAAKKVVGIETYDIEEYTPEHMRQMGIICKATRPVYWSIESERHSWTVVNKGKPRLSPSPITAASRPWTWTWTWTCVNNCTVPTQQRPKTEDELALEQDLLRGPGMNFEGVEGKPNHWSPKNARNHNDRGHHATRRAS